MRKSPYLFTLLFVFACAPGPLAPEATETSSSATTGANPPDLPAGDGDGDPAAPGDGDGEGEDNRDRWGQVLCLRDLPAYPYCFAQGAQGLALTLRPKWVGSDAWAAAYDVADAPLACVTGLEPGAFGLECYRPAGELDAPVECFARSTDPMLPVGLYFPIACEADAPWTVDPSPLSNACNKSAFAAHVGGLPTLCSEDRPTCRESLHGVWLHTAPECTLEGLDVIAVTDFAI